MNVVKEYLIGRHEEFWFDIYNIEKDEIRKLKDYIEYIKIELKEFIPLTCEYKSISALFMKMHLKYLEEAFSSLILGNYNALSCILRIIIENYVSYEFIKKYKKQSIYKDWYIWSIYKLTNRALEEPYKTEIKNNYDKLCTQLNVSLDYISNKEAYGWLAQKVKLRNYSFKTVSESIDPNIYKDFSYLSNNIHNTDLYTKINWTDMTLLTKYIYLIFYYTEKMIRIYKYNILRRNDYYYLRQNLLKSLDKCCNYK